VWEGRSGWSWEKTHLHNLFSTFNPTDLRGLPPLVGLRELSGSRETVQGLGVGAPSGMPPPGQGRARHSLPCFRQEMSGTAALAYCISSGDGPQAGFLGPTQIFENKRFIL
jgi:hypothetical protein